MEETSFPRDITQISLDVAFSTSSFTIDGTVAFNISGYSRYIKWSRCSTAKWTYI